MVANSAIQRHLLSNIKHIEYKTGSREFEFFGNLPLPVVRETNEFDLLVEIVSEMMLVVGSVLQSDLFAPIHLAKANYTFEKPDRSKVYSSEKYQITKKSCICGEKEEKPLPAEYLEMIRGLSTLYMEFFAEKWNILGPIVKLNIERKPVSNYYVVMFSQNPTIDMMYELLCTVYDEALEQDKDDVIIEVMQIAFLHIEMYPDYMGFYDLMGVAHYNRNEFSDAIGYWKKALDMLESVDKNTSENQEDEKKQNIVHTIEKMESMLASAEVKLHLEIGCRLASTDPGTAMIHLQNAKPVFSDWWVFTYYMGVAYLTKQDYAQAKAYFVRTLELFSGCHEAFERLADVYYRLEQYDKVYESLENSLRINPNNGEVLGKLIIIADKVGKLKKVASLIKHAKQLDYSNDYVVRAERLLSRKSMLQESHGMLQVGEKKRTGMEEKKSSKRRSKKTDAAEQEEV